MIVVCEECGQEFDKEMGQIKQTKHNFCSRPCAGKFNGRRRKGPYKNRDKQYSSVRKLRKLGYSFSDISDETNIPLQTVWQWSNDIVLSKQAQENHEQRKKEKRLAVPLSKLISKTAILSRLLEIRGHKCETCSITEWQSKPIMIEGHHKDGNNKNHNPDNILLLCPNCHSQTPNYRNKSRQ